MATDDLAPFVRWQGRTIEQLGQVLSVVLGLAVASLGFDVALLMDREFEPASWQKYTFAAAILAFLVSIAFGLWCIVNRLRDFRLTMWAARDRETDPTSADASRAKANRLGKKTWILLWSQLAMFGLGILLTVAVVTGVYGHKLL